MKDYDLSKSQKTQVATTGGSYKKARTILDELGVDDNVLDFGAGRGHGTPILRGESLEPYPQGGFKPDYTTPPDKSYKGVVNLNVLNVLPEPTRSEVAKQILDRIDVGGHAVIGARSYSDVMGAKDPQLLDDGGIMTKKGTYQYGFGGKNESLIDYLSRQAESMPDKEFDIKKQNIAATGALVSRLKGALAFASLLGLVGMSEDASAGELAEMFMPLVYDAVKPQGAGAGSDMPMTDEQYNEMVRMLNAR